MQKVFPTCFAVLIAMMLCLFSSTPRLKADDGQFLNFVIYNLPPEYFADIPLEERSSFLRILSKSPKDKRLDYQNKYLHWYSDGGSISASSQLRVKLFPRKLTGYYRDANLPYVFVHMPKPFADGSVPADDQSFVLEWKKGKWEDVTEKILPKSLDRKLHLRPERQFFGIRAYEYDVIGLGKPYKIRKKEKSLYVWQDYRFREKRLLPLNSRYEAPFDPAKLTKMALAPEEDQRELTEIIIHAGIVKDERFRYLLASKELNAVPVLAMALAFYRHAIDQEETAVDFIVRKVAKEGRGDTNSLWIMSYFDEWDKTIEAYDKYSGGDGAAGEASYVWMVTRKALYPEKFREWKAEREKEKD